MSQIMVKSMAMDSMSPGLDGLWILQMFPFSQDGDTIVSLYVDVKREKLATQEKRDGS